MHLHSSETQHMSEQNHSPQASTQDSYESVENPQALDKGSPPSVEGGDRDRNREREETVKNSPIISEDTESCNSVAYNEDSNDYSKVIIFQDREAGSYVRASELSCAEAPADDAALETESCDVSVGRDTQESICESRLSTPAVVAEGEMVSQEETAAMSVATTQEIDTTADRTDTTADRTETTADRTETTADVTETTADVTETTADITETTADRTETTADGTETTADITITSEVIELTADITETTAEKTETTAEKTETTADRSEATADITEATADRRDTLGINSQDTDGEVDYGDTTLNLSVECAESFPAVFRVSS